MQKCLNMKKITLFLAFVVLLSSCSKSDQEATIVSQEANIDSYIASKFSDKEVVRNNGVVRVIVEQTEVTDVIVEEGDSVYFYYAGYVFTNQPSSLFDTNVKLIAESSSFVLTNQDYTARRIKLDKKRVIDGLYNGFLGMKEGEHAIILFSAKHGYNNSKLYNIPKLSALAYEVWIEKIVK